MLIQDVEKLAMEFESFVHDEEKDFREFFNSDFETKVNMLAVLFMKADEIFSRKLENTTIANLKMCLAGFALGFLSGTLFSRKLSFEELCETIKEKLQSLSDEEILHVKKSFGVLIGFVSEEMTKCSNVVIEDKLNMQ